MSQRNGLTDWLFKHFVSDDPEVDFSQVIDFQDEVDARRQRVAQIPEERRVRVVEEVILDEACEFIVDEEQQLLEDFDASLLSEPLVITAANHAVAGPSGIGQGSSSIQSGSGMQIGTGSLTSQPVAGPSGLQNGAQIGAGARSQGPLFTITKEAARTFQKFNMQGVYYQLEIKKRPKGAFPEEWLRQLLNSVITYFKTNSEISVLPGDYIGLQLSNPSFKEKPVYVGLRRADQMDAGVIFEKLMLIFDSNKEFLINGLLEIEFNHIRMPHGSGFRIRRKLGETNEEFINGKVSFIKYKNPRLMYPDDEYCLPYALVVARAALAPNPSQFNSITRSIYKLRESAKDLCKLAGVRITPGGCSIEEVKKFQAVMPNFQISIFTSLEPKHIPYTDLQYYQKSNKLNIFLENGHYTAMRSLSACLAAPWVCPDCHSRVGSWLKHRNCVYTCPCCLSRPPCQLVANEDLVNCDDCLRSFRGIECFYSHIELEDGKNFTVCQRIKRCGDCDVVYYVDNYRKHNCATYYCSTCEAMRDYEHQCYMPVYKTKRDPDSNVLYVIYDFETQQDTLLDPLVPNRYKHEPNLCVAHLYCNTCRNDLDISNNCEDCGVREHILFSEDCVGDLLGLISDRANERKVDTSEEEEETDEPTRKKRKKTPGGKKFKKVVAIAHNMGGFDGQFILSYILNSKRFSKPRILMNGSRLIRMDLGHNVAFLDSLNYFHTALSELPGMLGFEGVKGYFPHLFNTRENAGRVVPLVDKSYFSPNTMSEKGQVEFTKWYNAHPADYEFDHDKELIKYCIQDVTILRKACITFSDEFWEMNRIDPFIDACTIAGACNRVFRSNYLYPDTISVLPTNGYRFRDNQSKIALKWLSLIEINEGIEIVHAARGGEKLIPRIGKVDGYHEPSNRVFEFQGCHWHGCEDCYPNQYQHTNYKQPLGSGENADLPFYEKPLNEADENDERNQTMFIRRENTERKCKAIRDAGYDLVVMKECVFRRHLWNTPREEEMVKNLPILINEPLEPRDAFTGGRTNANILYFKSDGETKLYYYDICSLYPFINKTSKYPINHPKVHIGDTCKKLTWQHMDGLMKVTVSAPRGLAFPVLPTRMHSKLMFFLCSACAKTLNQCKCEHTVEERSFTGTWVIDEVKLALSKGYEIVTIHEIWEYEVTCYDPATKTGGLFVGYINTFLKIKAEASGWPKTCKTGLDRDTYINEFYEREGILLDKHKIKFNAARRQMAKDMLNSFWGRFGLRPDLVRTIIVETYDELIMKMLDPKIEMNSVTPINDDALLLSYNENAETRRPNNTSNVVIAAFTTAYARMELYKYLDALGVDRIYYFDTDSIFFTVRPGDKIMPVKGVFLGQMTDELEKDYGEGTYIIEFVSGGPKNYAFKAYTPSTGKTHTVVKVKGITLNHETVGIVNFDLIKKFITNPDKIEDLPAEKLDENGEPKVPLNTVKVPLNAIRRTDRAEVYSTKIEKTYRVSYTKRKVANDFTTTPYGF